MSLLCVGTNLAVAGTIAGQLGHVHVRVYPLDVSAVCTVGTNLAVAGTIAGQLACASISARCLCCVLTWQ
jgi:hypothetical protein